MVKTKTTGSVKKSITKKNNITASQDYINRNGVEAFGKLFESIKHTVPEYEPDREELSLAIRAELAVVKAEEEKKAREEEAKPNYHWKIILNGTYSSGTTKDALWMIKDWYSSRYLYEQKQRLTKYLIRSIISSLGLGATAMFLILNT